MTADLSLDLSFRTEAKTTLLPFARTISAQRVRRCVGSAERRSFAAFRHVYDAGEHARRRAITTRLKPHGCLRVVPQEIVVRSAKISGGFARRSTSNPKEWTMKLNATQLKQTLSQMDAQVLPEDHPALGQLSNLFGEHTFFLDESGLKVLEPGKSAGAPNRETGEVVSLADWADASLTSLRPHEPELTGAVVVFKESKH
jgi:hypothetical protein